MSTKIATLPANQEQLDTFQENLYKSLQCVQQQINELEIKDTWNLNLLLMIGPYDFISDNRSAYAQRHTLLLELRDRLNKIALLVNHYRNALDKPHKPSKGSKSNEGDFEYPLMLAVSKNWPELVDLQKQIAALPED